MSAIVDFTVAVLDCAQCDRPFMESYVAVAMHDDRVICPHCNAEYVTEPDMGAILADIGHGAQRGRRTRPQHTGAAQLFGNLRRKLQ